MRLYLYIDFKNVIHSYSFLNNGNVYSKVFLEDFCYIDIHKQNNHSYFAKGFFYNSKLVFFEYANTKSSLYEKIQSLLNEQLFYVEQFCNLI